MDIADNSNQGKCHHPKEERMAYRNIGIVSIVRCYLVPLITSFASSTPDQAPGATIPMSAHYYCREFSYGHAGDN
jgi:hypothetical protein